MRSWNFKGALGAFAAASLLLSSTAASAASPSSYYGPDPLAVLSVMSSGASASVLCGAAAASAASQTTAPGCVLPQIDAQPAVAADIISQPVPVPLAGAAGGSFAFSPLLIGLLALAGGVGLYLILHKGGNNNNPVSPA